MFTHHVRYFGVKTGVLAVFLLMQISSQILLADPVENIVDGRSVQTPYVEVETRGAFPGCSKNELRAYVDQRMRALATEPWRFEPADPLKPAALQALYPNRVIWTFQILPDAAGTVRYIGPGNSGWIVPPGIRRKVLIEALLIRDHRTRGTMTDEIWTKGCGPNDAELDPLVSHVLERLTSDDAVARDTRD